MHTRRTALWLVACWAVASAAWSDTPVGRPKAVNLALHQPTRQSSTYGGTGISQSSELGVDGVIAPAKDPQFLFHTTLEANPWWQVDLGAVKPIGEVHLHNRVVASAPEVAARARTVQVLLSDDGTTWRKAYQHDGTTFTVLRLPLRDTAARYVRIQLTERAYLHMYEVEVFGPRPSAAAPPPATATAGAPAVGVVFPSQPFNGMQITYTVTGATLEPPTDVSGFTTTRSLRGRITGNTLAVSGTVRVVGLAADVVVSVWNGSQKEEQKLTVAGQGPTGAPAGFSVAVPVSAATGGFSIAVEGHFVTGREKLRRGLQVTAQLTGAATLPAGGGVTASGGASEVEPGPPTDLPSLPPEPAGPLALPPNPLPPVPAGKQLVQAVVGPAGGKVVTPGALTMVFPAGALARKETITITTGPALAGARLYDIKRTGQGLMPQPVQLTFKLPTGIKPDEVLALHELAPQVYEAPRFHYDPATQLLTTEVNHCSIVGVGVPIIIGLTAVWATGAADPLVAPLTRYATAEGMVRTFAALIGAAGGAFAAKTVGLVVLGVPGLGVLVGMAGGAYAASQVLTAAYDAYLRMGLSGPVPLGRFSVYWPAEVQPQEPAIWLTLSRRSRQILTFQGPEAFTADVRGPTPITLAGVVETYLFPDLQFVRLPLSVLTVMERLQYADRWYAAHQMPLPGGPLDVVIRQMGGGKVIGETYNGAIHVNADALGGEAATGGAMDALIAHELFHLICATQGWTERRFVGSEDSLCVAMETQVFPDVTAFDEFSWQFVFPRLRNGLLREGPGEDDNSTPARRGYYLWPWTHYLAYTHGIEALRQYATGTMPDDVLAERFRHFCYAVISSDRGLRDPLQVFDLGGRRHAVSTGWRLAGRELEKMAATTLGSANATLPLGASNLRASCPLSLALPVFNVPREPGGTLVIRRDWPEQTEEYVAIRPQLAGERSSSGLPKLRPLREMAAMKGGMALRGPWVDDKAYRTSLPVAVICTATGQRGAPQTDARLIAYRLNPPSDVTMDKQPQRPTRLSWKLPNVGCALPMNDCLSSYRVFGKTKDNRDDLIAELYFDVPQSQLKPLAGKTMLSIAATQTQIELPAAATAQYVALGMQSVDKALTYPSGKQVMSEIAWSPLACTIAITPTPFAATVGKPLGFEAKASFPPPGAQYLWQSSGQIVSSNGATAQAQFAAEGPASVTVTLYDAAGKKLCAATATGEAKKKAAPPEQPQQTVKIPATGAWVLAKVTRDCEDTLKDYKGLQFEFRGPSSAVRRKYDHQGALVAETLHTWTLPDAIIPDQQTTFRVSAQRIAGKPSSIGTSIHVDLVGNIAWVRPWDSFGRGPDEADDQFFETPIRYNEKDTRRVYDVRVGTIDWPVELTIRYEYVWQVPQR